MNFKQFGRGCLSSDRDELGKEKGAGSRREPGLFRPMTAVIAWTLLGLAFLWSASLLMSSPGKEKVAPKPLSTFLEKASQPENPPPEMMKEEQEKEKKKEKKKGEEEVSIYRLKIGQPAELRGREITIEPGKVYNLRTGQECSWEEMLADLSGVKFIYIGETHTSFPMHRLQARIIQSLVERGCPVSVGVEMLPVTIQEKLTRWQLGILAEEEFLREARWYINWSYNFGYYRPIFKLIKDYHLPLYGLNVPREWITRLRMKGRDSLSEEQKKYIPPLDLTNKEHRLLIRTMFESSGFSHMMKGQSLDKAFERYYRAQVAWDMTMAYNAWQVLQKEEIRRQCSLAGRGLGGEAQTEAARAGKLVILAGSGHLLYNLGINGHLGQRDPRPGRTIISLEIPKKEGKVKIFRTVADYVIGLQEEEQLAFPTIGLSLKRVDGLANLVVSRNPITGVAKKAGVKKGDVILAVDGRCFQDKNELYLYLSQKQYGEEGQLTILRDGERKTITLKF
ncbi:ChaN family lipoprotein [Candidatus Aminicenantes bacterium AC-334-K16]|nr:ChaN family lipoprotein [Candidatus Aminicenantes bacterium AC-334-K16]